MHSFKVLQRRESGCAALECAGSPYLAFHCAPHQPFGGWTHAEIGQTL